MATPFAILGIDHVVPRASDPVALERFYVEVLGCTLEKRQGKLTQLRAGRALIDIVPAHKAGPAAARRARAVPISIICACESSRSMRPPWPGILRPMARAAARKPRATGRKARGPRSISPIRKATESSSRSRSSDRLRSSHFRTENRIPPPPSRGHVFPEDDLGAGGGNVQKHQVDIVHQRRASASSSDPRRQRRKLPSDRRLSGNNWGRKLDADLHSVIVASPPVRVAVTTPAPGVAGCLSLHGVTEGLTGQGRIRPA